MAEPVLNIDTTEVQFVRIDGIDYPIVPMSDLSLPSIRKISRMYNVFRGHSDDSSDWSDEEAEQVSRALLECVRLVLPTAPDDVVSGRLTDVHRLAVVETFLEVSGVNLNQTTSSQVSSGSTEAVPTTG